MPTSPILTEFEKKELLEKIKLKAAEGYETLRAEPAWERIQDAIDAINGQMRYERTSTLSSTFANRLRRISNVQSGVLTDVRPIWSYTTHNDQVKKQGEILNKESKFWWRNRKVDRALKGALQYSGCAGTGYLYPTWDPEIRDIRIDVLDPRDVIPLEAAIGVDSLQDWHGVVIRQRMSVAEARRRWPDAKHLFRDTGSSWFGPEYQRGKPGLFKRFTTYFWEGTGPSNRIDRVPGTEILRTYLKDDSVNRSGDPMWIGEQGTNWGYLVPYVGQLLHTGEAAKEADCKIWPRGKLVLSTTDDVIEVLPNPYWHGKFPLVALKLFPAPWAHLGLSCIQDLLALQHSLNECVRGLDDARDQILQPAVIADRRAIAENVLKKIDSRQKGGHFHVDTTLTGSEGFRYGDPKEIPAYYIQYMQWLENEMDDLAGIKGIEQLAQLKQLPAQDTVEEFRQAMSPVLKDMARSLSVGISELAELMKFNFLQWYDTKRQLEILGEEGLTMADMDMDPGNMIPADLPGATSEARAKELAKNFHFEVAENSFLNMSNSTKKMMDFQLWRGGGLSLRSMWKSMDIQNTGKELGESEVDQMVAERRLGLLPGPPPELVQAQTAAALMQAQMGMMQMQMQMGTPQTGVPGQPPPQGGPPGGPGGGEAPVQAGPPNQGGRPPSGATPPHIEQKDGGTRAVVSES